MRCNAGRLPFDFCLAKLNFFARLFLLVAAQQIIDSGLAM